MKTPKAFVAKFRKAVEKELKESLNNTDRRSGDFEWRNGRLEHVQDFWSKDEKEPLLRVTVRLRVQVVVEDVHTETL